MKLWNGLEHNSPEAAVQNLRGGLVKDPVSKLEEAYWGDALGVGALIEVLEAWDGGTTKTTDFNKGEEK